VNKQPKTKIPTPASQEPEPPAFRLDEKITNLIIEFARFLKRIWLPLSVAAGVILVVFLIYGLVIWIHSTNEESLAARAFALTESKEAQEGDFVQSSRDLDALLKDAQGSDGERIIFKQAVAFLKKRMSPEDLGFLDGEIETAITKHVGSENAPDILKKIEEYARLAQERFQDDADMQTWAKNNLDWVKGEREFKEKKLEKRTYTPVIPATPDVPAATQPVIPATPAAPSATQPVIPATPAAPAAAAAPSATQPVIPATPAVPSATQPVIPATPAVPSATQPVIPATPAAAPAAAAPSATQPVIPATPAVPSATQPPAAAPSATQPVIPATPAVPSATQPVIPATPAAAPAAAAPSATQPVIPATPAVPAAAAAPAAAPVTPPAPTPAPSPAVPSSGDRTDAGK
jgi:hypothetical protein